MNQFCLKIAARLQTAALSLPDTVFSVMVHEPVQNEFGEDTSEMNDFEAQEDIDGKRHWLVFETLTAARAWVRAQSMRSKYNIEESHVDTIEWLDLLVLNDIFSPYIAISLVKGKLVRTPRKWVK